MSQTATITKTKSTVSSDKKNSEIKTSTNKKHQSTAASSNQIQASNNSQSASAHQHKKRTKTATISMRVEPDIKAQAEEVCNRIGLSTTDAINMFLYRIVSTQGIPLDVSDLSECPDNINLDKKEKEEFEKEILLGLNDVKNGNVYPIKDVISI